MTKTPKGWLSVAPSIVNGTELSCQEFRDSVLLRYARSPSDLPSTCDGCGKEFTIRHALACKTGRLINGRHDEVRDVVVDLASKASSPSHQRTYPHDIFPLRFSPFDSSTYIPCSLHCRFRFILCCFARVSV